MRSENPVEFVEMLLARLERVQADSYLAHQASGVRGSLIKALENKGARTPEAELRLRGLTEAAFQILLNAARNQSRQDSLSHAALALPGRAAPQTDRQEPEGSADAVGAAGASTLQAPP